MNYTNKYMSVLLRFRILGSQSSNPSGRIEYITQQESYYVYHVAIKYIMGLLIGMDGETTPIFALYLIINLVEIG